MLTLVSFVGKKSMSAVVSFSIVNSENCAEGRKFGIC